MHYRALQCSTVHCTDYTTLHHTTVHYSAMQYIALRYIALYCIAIYCITIKSMNYNYITRLHRKTPQYIARQHNTLQYNTIQYNTIQYTTIHDNIHYHTLPYILYITIYLQYNAIRYHILGYIRQNYDTSNSYRYIHYDALYTLEIHYAPLRYTRINYNIGIHHNVLQCVYWFHFKHTGPKVPKEHAARHKPSCATSSVKQSVRQCLRASLHHQDSKHQR